MFKFIDSILIAVIKSNVGFFSVVKDKGNVLDALRDSPTSAIVILISFFGMWTVIGLAGFHTYLIAVEQTTNEDVSFSFLINFLLWL